MRHVPEDELHAYLDQALSRSQCVEIETHLAACDHCAGQRDTIAALRDRTTALLGELTPRSLIIPPPFETLAERLSRHPVDPLWKIRLRRASLWAAGVAAAVGAGWVGRSLLDPHQGATTLPVLATDGGRPTLTAAPDSAIGQPDFVPEPMPEAAAPPAVRTPPRRVAYPVRSIAAPVIPAPVLQLVGNLAPSEAPSRDVAVANSSADPITDRLWRSVTWEEALDKAGSGLPYIEGLPVLRVLFQQGDRGERPTAIVAQQDASGEIIMSIEGPVARVNEVLKRQYSPELHASEFTRTTPDYVDEAGRVRRNLRILTVTGRLPLDSLNALARLATIR